MGCLLQITLAVIILRTEAGFSIFQRIGLFTQTFISYVESGASFVFGEAYFQHFFAFFVRKIRNFCSVMHKYGRPFEGVKHPSTHKILTFLSKLLCSLRICFSPGNMSPDAHVRNIN